MHKKNFNIWTSLTFTLAIVAGAPDAIAASAINNTSATVVAPIGIVSTVNMSFGKLAAGTGGTVVVSTAGVRSKTGGVTLVLTGSTHSQATFNVTGSATLNYGITLPVSAPLTSGANTMTVSTFTSNPSGTGTLSATGSQPLNVGATLTVANNQVAGLYTGSFTVTVDYN